MPNLRDAVVYTIEENSLNVPVDLSGDPPAFPIPTNFRWTRNGSELNYASLTYSTITFPSVSRSDSGNYAVSATNFVLNNDTVPVGSDMGSFSLDVICKIIVYYSYFLSYTFPMHCVLINPVSLLPWCGFDNSHGVH
jgi:hypothetical protein